MKSTWESHTCGVKLHLMSKGKMSRARFGRLHRGSSKTLALPLPNLDVNHCQAQKAIVIFNFHRLSLA